MAKKGISKGKVLVGAGLAAAGAYYLLGPDGKKHQNKAKAMVKKVEKEVESDIKKVIGTAKKYEAYGKKVKGAVDTLKGKAKGITKKKVKTAVRKVAKRTIRKAKKRS